MILSFIVNQVRQLDLIGFVQATLRLHHVVFLLFGLVFACRDTSSYQAGGDSAISHHLSCE
jgi:hypothetical protein